MVPFEVKQKRRSQHSANHNSRQQQQSSSGMESAAVLRELTLAVAAAEAGATQAEQLAEASTPAEVASGERGRRRNLAVGRRFAATAATRASLAAESAFVAAGADWSHDGGARQAQLGSGCHCGSSGNGGHRRDKGGNGGHRRDKGGQEDRALRM